eukprot:577285-Rhodomonas_salina.1
MSPPRLTCEPPSQDTRPGAQGSGQPETARDSLAFLQGRHHNDWCRQEPTRSVTAPVREPRCRGNPFSPPSSCDGGEAGRASLASSYPHPFPVVLGWKSDLLRPLGPRLPASFPR